MRPPAASDYVPQRRLRVRLIQKVSPYNAGEDRTVDESVARKLCILGVAVPSPKLGPDDLLGGWSLAPQEVRASQQMAAERTDKAGDFADELAAEDQARAAEAKRVEDEAKAKNGSGKKEPKKVGFLKGLKGAKEETGETAPAQ
ncbi:MAG: hypothetical protein ACREIS_08240 [Nitrospiraceae bacterium]